MPTPSSIGPRFCKVLLFWMVLLGAATCWGYPEQRWHVVGKEYTVTENGDGGYTLNITLESRYWGWSLDGFFPKTRSVHEIMLVGRGYNRNTQNETGFYYRPDLIRGYGDWDVGWAWVSATKKEIHLNLYWIRPPDKLVPAHLGGCYKIEGHEAGK